MFKTKAVFFLSFLFSSAYLQSTYSFVTQKTRPKGVTNRSFCLGKLGRHRSHFNISVCCKAHRVPTLEELSTDGFTKQLSHSENIISMLESESDDVVHLLKAQLGHSDGIRGFFVTYLTMDDENMPFTREDVPQNLLMAMNDCANEEELVSLMCMNVIMPTGMITMHKDPNLSLQSQETAKRAVQLLRALRQKPLVQEQCKAILAVATDESFGAEPQKVAFWKDFFKKWGYEEVQNRDIAEAVKLVLSN